MKEERENFESEDKKRFCMRTVRISISKMGRKMPRMW
jgi:hypothetical protein